MTIGLLSLKECLYDTLLMSEGVLLSGRPCIDNTFDLYCRYLCSQTVDYSKAASKSISSSSSSNKTSTVNIVDNDDDEDDESISEILEQCIRNAEDVESEFVREEEKEDGDNTLQGEQIDLELEHNCVG